MRKINPNKATGSDGISGQMLLLCDDSVSIPLQIIYSNILSTSIYPDIWKLASQWKLEFNPDPLKQATEVLFSCKKNIPNHPPIFFNGIVVAKVKEQKHLGLILEPNLSFSKHLSGKIKKAKQNLGIIKHLSSFFTS